MEYLLLIHLTIFLIYLCLVGFVLFKNPKKLLNQVCTFFILCFAIGHLGNIFIHNVNISKDVVKLFTSISSIGRYSFASFALWFFLVFTKKDKILEKKIIYLLLFFPPTLFIYKEWTDFLTVNFIRQPYGWTYNYLDSIWTYFLYTYFALYVIICLYLCLDFRKKTKILYEKKQASIIFSSMLICLVIILMCLPGVQLSRY